MYQQDDHYSRGSRRYRSPSPPRRSGCSSRYRSPSPPPRRHRSPRASPSRYRSPSPGSSRHGRRERDRDSSRPERKERSERGLPDSFSRDRDDERRKPTAEDNRNVLERMEKSFDNGPLEVLHRCCKENLKLKVWTRNFKEVRGICTGYVVAFDKHWNLVMKDVDEVFLKPRKGKTPFLRELKPGDRELIPEMKPKVPKEKKKPAPAKDSESEEIKEEQDSATQASEVDTAASGVESGIESMDVIDHPPAEGEKKKRKKKKKNKGPNMNKRHVKQLFVRGDNVVMVAILAPSVA